MTVARQTLAGPVGDLLAILQVEVLDVVAVQGERVQGGVADGLASSEAELSQEPAAPSGDIFDDDALDVDLKGEQVHILPVGSV